MSTPTTSLQGGAYKTFRKDMKAIWQAQGAACGICGQRTIKYNGPKNEADSFELDHIISRKRAKAMGRLDLILDPKNAQPSHVRCNRSKQAGEATPQLGETSEEW